MHPIKKCFPLLALVLSTLALQAQTYSLDGVENFYSGGIKPVLNGDEVTGYTIFYKTDKADSKNDNYGFELLDEKLNKVSRQKVVLPRNSILINTVYNGEALGLMFYDRSKGTYSFKAYDKTLKLAGSATSDKLNKYERAGIDQMESNQVAIFYGIHPVPGKGFVRAGYGEDKDQFSITCFDSAFKKKWRYQTPDKQDGMETFILSDVSDKYVSGLVMRRSRMTSTKFEYFLAVFDVETGKKLLDVSVEKANENLSISGTILQGDQILVQGEFYDKDDKAGVNKSQGMYLKRYEIAGAKELSNTKFSWKKDIEKLFDAKGKQSIEDNYLNFPQTLIQAANGHTYIVFEQFKKAVDGVGVAVNLLGGSGGMTKVKVGNLWVFELDAEYKPVAIKYYEKDGSNVGMPPGAGFYGSGLLGMFVRGLGGFDYQFRQQSQDKSTFNVAYVNYDRERGEKTKVLAGNIFLAKDGSLNYDKIDVTPAKRTTFALYPAPQGSVMLAQYNTKEEKLELKLVKLNY